MNHSWKKMYDFRIEPYWKDGCGHGGYLFSITTIQDKSLDVYCFDNKDEQEFCLRYGPVNSDYYSPGSILNILRSNNHDPYYTVWECLQHLGKVSWIRIT